eukprot:Seg2672.4 transcript_id=Seg2672.4/GoldUCD/mRNA.D3Y31 product="28S ribosomal protein S24-B mitochondrial" pseudo=true protein_id=Seg2672.4/GoldUCD/D3Y31
MLMNVLLRKINKNSCIWNNCIINNLRCASSRPRNKIKYFTKNDAPPHRVGVIKSWDSKHTGGIEGSLWAHDRFIDDVMIRKFIQGTFYEMIVSDIIVKRRLNQIIISIFVNAKGTTVHKVYFLVGFAEKMLSHLLGCIVNMEVMSVSN